MKRKKVLYIQPVQSPYVTPRLEALAADPELEVVLVLEQAQSIYRPGWVPSPIPGCAIEVMHSKTIHLVNKYDDLGYKVSGIRFIPWQLPGVIWRHRPDVVIVCNATELLLALVIQPFLRFKIMINVEDTLHAIRNKTPLSRALKAWTYRRADIQLAFGRKAEEYLHSIGLSDTIRRTSWSLNLDQFKRDPMTRERKRDELGVKNRLTFLFVGALIPLKGVMQLLRAWAVMPADFRAEASLIVIGDGQQRTEAHAMVDNMGLSEVIFIQRVPYDAMPMYYAAADIFILPTLQDLFSLVVVEAMASSCPVMTTPYNGASELVKEHRNGWLFDPADESSIRDALNKAFQSRNEISAMGQAAEQDIQPLGTKQVMGELAKAIKALGS